MAAQFGLPEAKARYLMNIVVIATLDTKGEEADFIRSEIFRRGHTPL